MLQSESISSIVFSLGFGLAVSFRGGPAKTLDDILGSDMWHTAQQFRLFI